MDQQQPAEGPVRQQQDPDGGTSSYDGTGDRVEKDAGGGWVKKGEGSQAADPPTTSAGSSGETTGTPRQP